MDWLEDESVNRHLSDSRHVSRFIEQVIGRVQLPILTHLFNRGGRFFMAYDRHDVPVGFVRLVKTGPDCEMVLVIGNRDNWGRQLGAGAIREGMKLVYELEHEIERAIVVDPRQVPRDVVTMNSRALLQLDDEELEVALVYPEDADDSAGRLSVCGGMGTAILGCREGDAFAWRIPDRTCHIRIGKVLYQPEAAGDFHL